MDQAPAPEGLPPSLRFLKGLVIVLTLTMIIGVITVVAVIVTRMPQSFAEQPGPAVGAAADLPASFNLPAGLALPASLALPDGALAQAVTFGKGWIAVVTDDNRILIFSAEGDLRQEVSLLAQ